MSTVKRITDLTAYTSVLPYASELFGVYQPLLGWRSSRIERRARTGYERDKVSIREKLIREFADLVEVRYTDGGLPSIEIRPGVLKAGKRRAYDNVVMEKLAAGLPPYDRYKPSIWADLITPDKVDVILKKDVIEVYSRAYQDIRRIDAARMDEPARRKKSSPARAPSHTAFENQLRHESTVAGALLFLTSQKAHGALEHLFYLSQDRVDQARTMAKMLESEDGGEAVVNMETLNPTDRAQLTGVYLSPISVVHLFRQYFFELDSFLGTPESHVWLSPGSSVELIEVHTRKTTVEKTLETALETLTKAETSTTQQEEISEAVKEDNQRDVKCGASVTAKYATVQATASFDYASSQKVARETAHKRMRQQTEKLSSEIRKNFKSTFKTITETTDVASTKHVLANTTHELVNYELRRKMRQVGVQVQDIGTFLCWQTFVDDPGRELGLAKLVHVATPPDLEGIPHPEEIPMQQAFQEERRVTVPFVAVNPEGADNKGEVYVDGVESVEDETWGDLEKIQADFQQEFVCAKSDYQLTNVEFDPEGKPVMASRLGDITHDGERASFMLHLDSADFQGQNAIQLKLILHWTPKAGVNDAITLKNQQNVAAFKAKERAAYEKALLDTVKERVDISSKITPRSADELREEERIVVYRRLIQDMLMQGIEMPDDRTRHVVSELINSIFDVDKMLYFVAPEWWRPRLHRSRQQLNEKPPAPTFPDFSAVGDVSGEVLMRGLARRMEYSATSSSSNAISASTVGWGGIDDASRDNYYITADSAPAKLGSSLGWLLQLDGDNMRNAFLNAPWVKAVIPIRPGREEAAINWLKGVEGMNGITDDVVYHASHPDEKDIDGNPLDGQKMIDVLIDLGKKIEKKYNEGIDAGKFPKQHEVSDPALVDDENSVTSTPIDRVFEHGFFPLENSFRANVAGNYEIFDQWLEILPTDQTVPVPVSYDPRTGRQI